jgi:uncharacterized membrane protein
MNQFTAPLWGDEGFSAILSMHSLPDIIKIIINDTSPPLWNISEWVVFNTLGTSEVFIRLLAFFYFLITAFFVYKIGSFLWDRKTGFIAALLTMLNPFFFTYAFEGRMYSIMSAGVAASFYFFIRIIFYEKKINKLHIIGYAIGTLWAMYSHHFAMFAIFAQGLWFLYFLFTKKKDIVIALFISYLLIIIGYLPWIWPLYHQVKMVGGGFWLGKPKIIDLVALILEYLAAGIKNTLAFPALVLTLATLALRKWKGEYKASLVLLSWFLVPIVAAFGVSQVFQSIFFNRYLLYTIPAAMILLGSRLREVSRISLAIIIVLFCIIDFNYFVNPVKLPFPDLANYVKASTESGDFLINWNSNGTHHLWETKYYGIPAPIYVQGENNLPYFVGTALMEKDDVINQIPKGTKRVGVVTSGPIEEIKVPGYTGNVSVNFNGLKFIWLKKS